MQALYMLDTDICIYLKKRRPACIAERFRQLRHGEVVISMITYGELFSGALKSREKEAAIMNVQLLAAPLPVQPMLVEVAEVYASIRSDLEKKGCLIGGNDLWIAAHAVALDLTLVTNNTRNFRRIDGLRLENWVE
jgi:tRNA(fMet)-specific endonuclease VapC